VGDKQPEKLETLVDRDEVAVMFKRVADEQEAIGRGWVELERAAGTCACALTESHPQSTA
jgi:hypothetical protein